MFFFHLLSDCFFCAYYSFPVLSSLPRIFCYSDIFYLSLHYFSHIFSYMLSFRVILCAFLYNSFFASAMFHYILPVFPPRIFVSFSYYLPIITFALLFHYFFFFLH
uniref:Uncharacterized protein n=1 Tax=Cacopsylla melanoneura TaxID=428564 RepID=A0A8D8QWU7_9HEMI